MQHLYNFVAGFLFVEWKKNAVARTVNNVYLMWLSMKCKSIRIMCIVQHSVLISVQSNTESDLIEATRTNTLVRCDGKRANAPQSKRAPVRVQRYHLASLLLVLCHSIFEPLNHFYFNDNAECVSASIQRIRFFFSLLNHIIANQQNN